MSNKNISSFFEVYAHEYDILTNASQREKYHRKEIQSMIDRFKPATVLDAGCATGLSAKLFAEYSITSIGLDRSRKMVKIAKGKYKNLKKHLTFTYGYFENLPRSMYNKFDLVVCLGNSISGVGSISSLRKSLKNFYFVLKPGGSLILQMLNYSVLKENQMFPIRATENNGIVYERFSERRSNRLYVYITRLDLKH
ncbi:MAG: class I SAM-dependent methyltransferase, partial [Candidatus Zixiibacteriota bacterium]